MHVAIRSVMFVGIAQPPTAASGRRMLMVLSRVLLATPAISYDVGGAQHVAVNCTIYASSRDLAAIQTVLSESVKGGDFVQALNRTGDASLVTSAFASSFARPVVRPHTCRANITYQLTYPWWSAGLPVEKVEIVLFQQIAGPVAGPAPAPAPAPQLAQQIVGIPVTTFPMAPVPVMAPAAPAPPGGPSKTVIIASSVSVAAAAGADSTSAICCITECHELLFLPIKVPIVGRIEMLSGSAPKNVSADCLASLSYRFGFPVQHFWRQVPPSM